MKIHSVYLLRPCSPLPWLLFPYFGRSTFPGEVVSSGIRELPNGIACIILGSGWRESEKVALVLVGGSVGWIRRVHSSNFLELGKS